MHFFELHKIEILNKRIFQQFRNSNLQKQKIAKITKTSSQQKQRKRQQ